VVAQIMLTVPSFLPESPRYLISKDRRDEAFDILVKYHVSCLDRKIFFCSLCSLTDFTT
jgi:hypothetical protein